MFLIMSVTSFMGMLTNRSFISYVISLQFVFMGNCVSSAARFTEFIMLYKFLKLRCVFSILKIMFLHFLRG